jgi:hypothetical protein
VTNTKNLTVTLNGEEHKDLNNLVEHFQIQSISNVTKTDVIKYLIKQKKTALENEKVL